MFSSRDELLPAGERNQPDLTPVPDITSFKGDLNQAAERFTEILTAIGGKIVQVKSMDDIREYILQNMDQGGRNITTVPMLGDVMEHIYDKNSNPHSLQD